MHTDAVERMTIDSSGNVGIGTSPENSAGTWRNLQFGGGNLAYRNGGANDAMIGTGYLFKTDNSEVYKNAEAVSRLFFDNSSMVFQQAGSGSAGAAISWSEALRIDASGNLLVGTTNTTFSDKGVRLWNYGNLEVVRTNDSCIELNRTGSDGIIARFHKDGTAVGNISVTGSATAYNTSSDGRLKDITGSARGLEVINELNPVSYNWKATGQADEGLIAQEVLDIVPNAVTGSEEDMYQMDYSKLVVHLVAGMKEQQTQIEALQSEINLLKGE